MSEKYVGDTGSKKWMGEREPSLETLIKHSKEHAPAHHIIRQHHAGGGEILGDSHYQSGGNVVPNYGA